MSFCGAIMTFSTLIIVLSAVGVVSLISFVGAVFLAVQKELNKVLFILVSFATGGLIGGAFIHLVPESFELLGMPNFSIYLISGFLIFFITERLLHWHHCHEEVCEVLNFNYLILIGDGIHNFVDGLIIAVAFLASFDLGIVATIAVIMHEVPQEIGDFAILVYSGFSNFKALLFNFLSALTAVLGGVIGVVLGSTIAGLEGMLLGIAAGGFIYVAGSDLVPELQKEHGLKKTLIQVVFVLLGVLIMWYIA